MRRLRKRFPEYDKFLREADDLMLALLRAPELSMAEAELVAWRGRALVRGLAMGMTANALQTDTPVTHEGDGGEENGDGPTPQELREICIRQCVADYEACIAGAEEEALETAGRKGRAIGTLEWVGRLMLCLTRFFLCMSGCEAMWGLEP